MGTLEGPGGAAAGGRRRWRWWFVVGLNVFFLLAGQTAATLLGRFYYDQGGNSKWMATLVQSAGFPILLFAYIFFPSSSSSSSGGSPGGAAARRPPAALLAAVYLSIGLLVAGDNLMYSYGLLYLPVSTYSLICATQLAFNAVLSRLINSQKFTHLILNSVLLLTFSAALLGYALGFILTLGASATYALILSLMQLAFERVIKRATFRVVLEMQIFTSAVAAGASAAGLLGSGEWRSLAGEAAAYGKGEASYAMTLAGTAVAWQVASVGVVGLVFLVSSLFSNVISAVALPLVPIFAVFFFGDPMDGEKVLAMLLAVWGSASYVYQNYLDVQKVKKALNDDPEAPAVAVAVTAPPPPPPPP
ncbi:unnamed protein product [Spirodela intermedia]|uniref:Probable purine permease n=1 Tax=Spirodela intermedia TaxID=51605 RepID=A0A7I8JHZ4_SPIIN|nr:unnamed protein product [Spirodela intermedia]CAA6669730.1 unnamed protein product [Spirodela intermedia]